MNLRLHQLRALVAVVEHGGIRAAARALDLSQAALTKSLRQLEDDVGVQLLLRSPLGVTLTDAGRRLLARAQLVTRQVALAERELQAGAAADAGELRLALTPYVTLRHLAQAFRWFRQRYPRVALEIVDGLVSRALPRLRDGTLDLAVLADTGDLPTGEFHTQSVATVRQHVVIRAGHPVLANGDASATSTGTSAGVDTSVRGEVAGTPTAPSPVAAALAELEWVLTGPRDGLRSSRLKAVFARAGVTPPERILFCDTLAGLALLRSTDVAGVVPAPILDLPEGRGLVRLDVPGLDPGLLPLVMLTRPDAPLTPAGAFMVSCLIDAAVATDREVSPP